MTHSIKLQFLVFYSWWLVAAIFTYLAHSFPALLTGEQVATIHQFLFEDAEAAFRGFKYATYLSLILCGTLGVLQVLSVGNEWVAKKAQATVNSLLAFGGLFSGYSLTSLSIPIVRGDLSNWAQHLALGSMTILVVAQSLWIIQGLLTAGTAVGARGAPSWVQRLRIPYLLAALFSAGLGGYGFYLEWRSVIQQLVAGWHYIPA